MDDVASLLVVVIESDRVLDIVVSCEVSDDFVSEYGVLLFIVDMELCKTA